MALDFGFHSIHPSLVGSDVNTEHLGNLEALPLCYANTMATTFMRLVSSFLMCLCHLAYRYYWISVDLLLPNLPNKLLTLHFMGAYHQPFEH